MSNTAFVEKKQLEEERLVRKELRASGQTNDPRLGRFPAFKAIQSISDYRMQAEVYQAIVKAVESYDLIGIRLDSYFDQVAELANTQTVFKDMIQGNGIVRSTDFQVAWRELYANANASVEFFNLNAGLPAEAEMTRAVRKNTMGAYGNQLNIRWITSELAEQSPIAPSSLRNELANQMRMQLIRMKRFSNQKLLANTEVVSEIIGDVPQWGGFATRSTSNQTVLAANSDLTSPLLQSLVNTIANASSVEGLGYDIPLVMLVGSTQIGKVRDLMIARFPGEKSTSYLDYQARLQANFPNLNVNPDMVQFYRANPGGVVACIHEPQLTSGLGLMFDPRQPRLVKFQMMNSYGPWSIARPTPELTDLYAVFDFESLIDPLLVSRASYLNLA